MKNNTPVVVMTTIQSPTKASLALAARITEVGGEVIVIGDEKGPKTYDCINARFYSLEAQWATKHQLAAVIPRNSYSRKNIGYLIAISEGAPWIYETDDDNEPLECWTVRTQTIFARKICKTGWVNTYRLFTDDLIWPRGFPLDQIKRSLEVTTDIEKSLQEFYAPIQQGLASGSPDVDAIWRLILDRDQVFNHKESIYLPKNSWCPFNSQSTWWFPEAYPLMYLPSHVSFRMTDIWRSFIAQRCLWEQGYGVVFHSAEMFQDRNKHNLMQDFEQEIPGYLQNELIRQILEDLPLTSKDINGNLMRCYEALIRHNVIPMEEMKLLKCWLNDCESF